MKAQIFACDDVRFERGNKLSLMGLFSNEILVPKNRPVLNPIKFVFRLVLAPGDKARKFEFIVQGQKPQDQMVIELELGEPEDPNKETDLYQFINSPPTAIPESGFTFTVKVMAEGVEIASERLTVNQADNLERMD